MRITAEPRSDQWNADDFVQGPQTFTITGVTPGKAEQKYDIALQGSDRAWRPPLTVLRILLKAWGDDATQWVGRQATLYRDDSIRFGPNEVGGIRVSHLSHLEKPLVVSLSDKRGSRKKYTVEPLEVQHHATTAAPSDTVLVDEWISTIRDASTVAQLEAAWHGIINDGIAKVPAVIAAKNARKGELS